MDKPSLKTFDKIDFDNDLTLYEIKIDNLPGWNELTVQYGVAKVSDTLYYLWRVKGTQKVFRIVMRVVHEHHGSNFKEHIILALTKFREDWISWEKMNFIYDWQQQYKDFWPFITNME